MPQVNGSQRILTSFLLDSLKLSLLKPILIVWDFSQICFSLCVSSSCDSPGNHPISQIWLLSSIHPPYPICLQICNSNSVFIFMPFPSSKPKGTTYCNALLLPACWVEIISKMVYNVPHLLAFTPCGIPSFWVWMGHTDSHQMSKTKHTWWDVISKLRSHKILVSFFLPFIAFSLVLMEVDVMV